MFAQADHTTPVYLARENVAVGTPVGEAPIVLVDVNIGSLESAYLTPDSAAALGPGAIFTFRVAGGELVPRSALGTAADLSLRPVSITVTNPAPFAPGDVVEMWVVVEDVTGRDPAAPARVATGLHVSAVEADESIFAGSGGRIVHALVPEEALGEVLGALGS